MRALQLILFACLSSLVIWYGIVPAFSTIDSDFPNYYTSARLVVERAQKDSLYDDAWFERQIDRQGIHQPGKFSPFPPVDALIMVPLAFLPPHRALQAWTVVNLLLLGANILLLSKSLHRDFLWSTLLLLGSGIALINNFRLGQFYLAIALLVTSGYLYWRKMRGRRSGFVLGLAAGLKYFPVVFLPLLIARREWKLIFSFLFAILLLYGFTALVLGTEVYRQFLSVVTSHLDGDIQDPFSSTFQSWNSLLRRVFVSDPVWNPEPLVQWRAGYVVFKFAVYVLAVYLTVRGCRDAVKYFGPNAPSIQFALVGIAGLLLLPASATYHFLLLVLPVGLLLTAGPGPWHVKQRVLLALFILTGFIPYRYFRPFDGRGLLSLFAYPRLGLMIALFLVSVSYVRNPRSDPALETPPQTV